MIVFISHKKSQCGIYQYGLDVYNSLKKSLNYNFVYIESDTLNDIISFINIHKKEIKCIVYNYYPTTMPWINTNIIRKFSIKQIAIIHEFNQETIDKLNNNYFDAFLVPDPTINITHPYIYKINRLVPNFIANFDTLNEDKIIIGSFGFGIKDKGFEKIIEQVNKDFNGIKREIEIRLHIPFNSIIDIDGKKHALETSNKCFNIPKNNNIKLLINHKYKTKEELLIFLYNNHLNVFLYDENKDLGISSVIDYALAVKKPIAVTKCGMFRHITNRFPFICVNNSSLIDILKLGFSPLEEICYEWNEDNFIRNFEKILNNFLFT